jgi:translation initiation factor IF-3
VGLISRTGRTDIQRDKGQTISRDLRVNQMIRIPQVRVVDEEGAQLGVMPTPQALEMAQDRGYDLVEVAPMAQPPVVRFLDFGQYKYELTKREKEAKRKQRSVTFKEVRLTPKIGTGDFDTKVHRAIEFLEDGDRIKVTVRFRGRELTHPEIGRNLLARFVDRVKEHGVAERTPLLEGKSMHITMASVHKPKGHDAPERRHPTGVTPADMPPATTEAPAAAAAADATSADAPPTTKEAPPAAKTETSPPKVEPSPAPKTDTQQPEAETAEAPATATDTKTAAPRRTAVASPKATATPEPVQAGE